MNSSASRSTQTVPKWEELTPRQRAIQENMADDVSDLDPKEAQSK